MRSGLKTTRNKFKKIEKQNESEILVGSEEVSDEVHANLKCSWKIFNENWKILKEIGKKNLKF